MEVVNYPHAQKDEIDIKKGVCVNTVTEIVETVRRDMGMPVAELARRCGIDRKRLWYVLNGQREMRVDEFLKICVTLRLDPRSFVTKKMVEEVAEATRRSIGRGDGSGI